VNLFHELDDLNVDGLPRGMGLSSTLSELMMNDFDAYIRSINGVLFYCRFVDDIIILTTHNINKSKLTELIKSSPLPQGLEFHATGSEKTTYKQIRKTSEELEKVETFDFLGYQFKVNSREAKTGTTLSVGRRLLDVEISDVKIEKIKKRIIKSFCVFLSSKDSLNERLSILTKRLYFLSKNYPLINSSDNSQVLSGIFFNYKHISNPQKISEIDKFYQSLLFGNKSNLSKRIRRNLSYKDRYVLSNISFLDGFQEKKFCKFSYKDFKDIKKAWV
jgi:hypothetical protein